MCLTSSLHPTPREKTLADHYHHLCAFICLPWISLSAEMSFKGFGNCSGLYTHRRLSSFRSLLGLRGHRHLSLPLLAAFLDQTTRNSCGIYMEREISSQEEQNIWISVLAFGCSSTLICFHWGLGTGIDLSQQTWGEKVTLEKLNNKKILLYIFKSGHINSLSIAPGHRYVTSNWRFASVTWYKTFPSNGFLLISSSHKEIMLITWNK